MKTFFKIIDFLVMLFITFLVSFIILQVLVMPIAFISGLLKIHLNGIFVAILWISIWIVLIQHAIKNFLKKKPNISQEKQKATPKTMSGFIFGCVYIIIVTAIAWFPVYLILAIGIAMSGDKSGGSIIFIWTTICIFLAISYMIRLWFSVTRKKIKKTRN